MRLDPGYARAWAALALGYTHRSSAETDPQYRARAMLAAKNAVKLDPTLGEAHEALSAVYRFSELDWDKTIEEADTALDLDSTLQLPHHNKAVAFYHLGLFDLSNQESLAGMQANPSSRYEATLNRARNALYRGQYSTAEQLALGVDASSNRDWIVAEARFYVDRIEESERQLRELMAQPAAGNAAARARASLASLLAGAGRRAEAQRTLNPLVARGSSITT